MESSSKKSLLFLFLLFLAFRSSISAIAGCHLDDERALLQIKSAFNNVSYFSTWIPHTDCCQWSSVQCKRIPNRVKFLSIFDSIEIVGEIPSAIGDLPYLEMLILSTLPNLTGPIPDFFGKLPHIQTLELDSNRLTGSIPSYLGHLPKLRRINLQGNQLTGRIPDSFGSLMPDFVLFLSDNQLSGPIPRILGQVNFDILELGGNKLSGDASFLFGAGKTNIAHFNLSHNHLSFDLTPVVMPDSASLLILDLSHNLIYGSLPAWLGQAPEMYQFDVSYNRLCGQIPTIGGKLQGFAPASFSHNKCLCGAPLPPCKS